MSLFKVDDMAKVFRRSVPADWEYIWMHDMDAIVGTVGKILCVTEHAGVVSYLMEFNKVSWWIPEEALEDDEDKEE